MLIAEFDITVVYAQIVVHEKDVKSYEWTDEHSSQGFLYAPGDVSFGVPDHDGPSRLQIYRTDKFDLDQSCLWAVKVPFEVSSGVIQVGTAADTQEVAAKSDTYSMVFAAYNGHHISDKHGFLFKIYLMPCKIRQFEIIKKGYEVTSDRILRTDADEML